MPNTLRTPYFEYWDEAPHDWQKLILQKVQSGDTQVTVPIMWGVHEPTPGMKDFSKQSKLRIERLFTTAQSAGASIKLVIGFPSHPLAFPDWIKRDSDYDLVPKLLWEGSAPYFSMTQVPSLRANRLKEGFFSFLEELSAIISLYLSPEGPIKEVELALQPLELSQFICEDPRYSVYLGARYPDISIFNKRFQTHYKEISAITTPVGAKLIQSKRPWLFAFDYQWAREKILNDYFNETLTSGLAGSLKSVLKLGRSLNLPVSSFNHSAGVYFESTLIQFGTSDSISPLMIQGRVSSDAVQAFQWAKLVSEISKEAAIDFVSLPPLGSDSQANHSIGAVFCGKYLSSAAGKTLFTKLEKGADLFFPMGLPQYDENLECHEFLVGGAKKISKSNGVDWFAFSKNNGQVFYPVQSSTFSSALAVKNWLKDLSGFSEAQNNG